LRLAVRAYARHSTLQTGGGVVRKHSKTRVYTSARSELRTVYSRGYNSDHVRSSGLITCLIIYVSLTRTASQITTSPTSTDFLQKDMDEPVCLVIT
jgi:hypothetical protein